MKILNYTKVLLAGVSFLVIFLLSTAASPASTETPYSTRVTPNSYGTPQLRWIITNVTEETVFFWTGDVAWQANAGEFAFFQIQEIKNNDTHGQFTLGNMSVFTNDTNIGADLVLGIWPWQPGLVSFLDWETVDLEARAAVTGFLDGDFKILTDSKSKTYIYHQNKNCGK